MGGENEGRVGMERQRTSRMRMTGKDKPALAKAKTKWNLAETMTQNP